MVDRREPTPLRASLDRVVQGLGRAPLDVTSRVRELWPELVGDDLGPHASVVDVRGTELIVAVDDPAVASELRWRSAALVAGLSEALGDGVVTSVSVRIGRR